MKINAENQQDCWYSDGVGSNHAVFFLVFLLKKRLEPLENNVQKSNNQDWFSEWTSKYFNSSPMCCLTSPMYYPKIAQKKDAMIKQNPCQADCIVLSAISNNRHRYKDAERWHFPLV